MNFRGYDLPPDTSPHDAAAICAIAEALSQRDGWGEQRRGPEQAVYLARAIEALRTPFSPRDLECGRGLALHGHCWVTCARPHGHAGKCSA